MTFQINDKLKSEFCDQGFLIARGLFNPEEIQGLEKRINSDSQLASDAYGKRDASGNETKLAVRNELADSPYAAIVRSERVARSMEALLGDEVYHYHHKMMIKEPRVGGAWEWHQDYGYWYKNGCLYPDMASCLIAISPANQDNGCLQVIPETHKMGRIDHVTVGDQFQTDPDRVNAALERFPRIYCELKPGDAIFFHSNLLHRSDANTSDSPRLSIICCYNTKKNDPIIRSGRHPNYSPLEIWDDRKVSQILKDGNQ
jgi:ectoine hydroxylase-related dioxygenase (phytanoyl-CoA dioxygenase family)